MILTRDEIVEKLRLERNILADGGYGRSVHTPWRASDYFRDSITCPNAGETGQAHSCSECFLIDFVHPSRAQVNLPCHFIPLNPQGDTVDSLRRQGDVARLEAALLVWLDSTISDLRQEEAGDSSSQKE